MRLFMSKWALWLGLVLLVGTARAQDSKQGNWWMLFNNYSLGGGWNWHAEAQYRNYNFAGDLQQLLLRSGIGYNLSEGNNNLLLGYAYVLSANYVPGTDQKRENVEHRMYQQFITRQAFGRVFVQHRYRVEERWLEEAFRWRFRYFLSLNVPLNKPSLERGALYLSAYNEVFVNGHSPHFDRNRTYGALGYVLHPNLRVELGYMRQSVEKTGRDQFQIAIFSSLPLAD